MDEQQTEYGLDNCQRLLGLCRDVFGERMHEYYDGFPKTMWPKSAMPLIIVDKEAGNVNISATGTDEVTEQINIFIFMSDQDDIRPGDKNRTTKRKLQNWIEGMNPDNRTYHAGSLMATLRSRYTLDQYNIGNVADVNYEQVSIDRVNDEGVDTETLESARIQVLMTRRVIVLDRS